MQGNIYWVGSVSECEHYLRGFNNSVVEQPFRTRSCMIGNGMSSTVRPVYGVCVPHSCSANDIVDYVNRRRWSSMARGEVWYRDPSRDDSNPLPQTDRSSEQRECPLHRRTSIRCQSDPDHVRPFPRLSSLDSLALLSVLLVLITFFILLATGIHVAHGHEHDLKMDEVPTSGSYEPILSRTTTTESASITTNTVTRSTVRTSLPVNGAEEQDEETPLISQPRLAAQSSKAISPRTKDFISLSRWSLVSRNLVRYCSLINNYYILKRENQPKNLACLNGIRVLSLCWVILGHTVLFAAFYSGTSSSFDSFSPMIIGIALM